MRNVMAALAALLVALPAAAQTQVVPYNGSPITTGIITTAGDTVTAYLPGSQWATARVTTSIGGVALTQVAEYSPDNGVNWLPATSGKRIDAVSGNPQVVQFTAANGLQPISGAVYEFPLAATTNYFRIRASGGTGPATVNVAGGSPYSPAVPVVGVLYDTSVTAGAANNTGTINVDGWRQVTISIVQTTAATGAASLNVVDDAGTALPVGTSASIAVGTYVFSWGDSGSFGAANPFTMTGGVTSLALDRRFNVAVAGATTSATRIRVVARR